VCSLVSPSSRLFTLRLPPRRRIAVPRSCAGLDLLGAGSTSPKSPRGDGARGGSDVPSSGSRKSLHLEDRGAWTARELGEVSTGWVGRASGGRARAGVARIWAGGAIRGWHRSSPSSGAGRRGTTRSGRRHRRRDPGVNQSRDRRAARGRGVAARWRRGGRRPPAPSRARGAIVAYRLVRLAAPTCTAVARCILHHRSEARGPGHGRR
jgi:hypothetical protein